MTRTKSRRMIDYTGKSGYYPPIHAEPVAVSPWYVSEENRVPVGNLLTAGDATVGRCSAAAAKPAGAPLHLNLPTQVADVGFPTFTSHAKAQQVT